MAEVAVEVRDLSVQRGKRCVLSDVSLSAHFGEVLAVLGPNGAGKSSLLRALGGLSAYEGQVLLTGRELRSLSASERARAVSFVPQQSQLTAALPVLEVVKQGRHMHREGLKASRDDERSIAAALQQVDIEQLAERAFDELSCGEQKRVLLARALCSGARVLLLDEPTASLDIEHALRFTALLRELAANGYCVIVVLHQLDEALQVSDRALLLKVGHTLSLGPSAQVIDAPHVRELYGVELLHNAALGFRLPGQGS